jgi:hypothetical protein
MAHWVAMRYGISDWKARRLDRLRPRPGGLPAVAGALASGELGVDKVVELTRFATPETEADLLRWAKTVSCGAIRAKADLEVKRSQEQTVEVERSRSLTWWHEDEGRQVFLQGWLPSAQGAVITTHRSVGQADPGDAGRGGTPGRGARRADALLMLCSGAEGIGAGQDRATLVVHAPLQALSGDANARMEGGGIIPPQTAARMACMARVQWVLQDASGNPVRPGRMLRQAPAWMMRQLRYREEECRFPGCGSRRYSDAHHVRWWEQGGTTDLENLVLICSFHPPAGPRVRVEAQTSPRRRGPVVPSRRHEVPGGAGATGRAASATRSRRTAVAYRPRASDGGRFAPMAARTRSAWGLAPRAS